VWERFKAAPPPLGYDPREIPPWKDGPTSDAFAVWRLQPWRLRVLDAVYGRTSGAEGRLLIWRAPN
jgi:hypothetical protein